MKLHISPFTRIGLIFLLLSLHFIFFIMTISMFNFFFDHPKYNFDFINFTRASYNNLFNSCTYLNCKSSYTTTIFIDISFTFILFFQSIFFISKSFRFSLFKYFSKSNSYFVIYTSKLIQFSSFAMSIFLFQPLNYVKPFVIDLTNYLHSFWLYIPLFIGIAMIALTLSHHVIDNDELGTKLLFSLITNRDVEEPSEMLFGRNVIYHISRNPFRGGVMIVALFISPRWNLGKVIYAILFILTIIVESFNEEIFYYQNYSNYRMYYKSIKSRFYGMTVYKLVKDKEQ